MTVGNYWLRFACGLPTLRIVSLGGAAPPVNPASGGHIGDELFVIGRNGTEVDDP
ncbi:hypothetical protein B0H13DRAFT_2362427 [Mycena leptocephala]|nr:hypothetical protein B0H13DRAFT_2362427 [Mycena leptocephala]